jgi:hypothetical protein
VFGLKTEKAAKVHKGCRAPDRYYIILVKVKLNIPWTRMWEWRYSSIFLNLALDGGEWSASCPGRFTPYDRPSGTHWTGGWVGPRAGRDTLENRKILTLPAMLYRALLNDLGGKKVVYFLKSYTHKRETTWKLQRYSSETLVVTYRPQVALQSLSKENGVSSAKGTMFLVIGRGGPTPCPPRSPDLTPCDFYICGYVKEQI